ncbi:hypothetical protein TRIP_B330066 [uncultured Desulfatiglans sp.]|uniref:Uncharacterized protein n=1 Tax=Uncultured Desulfatiglans sp. TaxID=1748965 RepID=A0A653A722_UNCDX|nr:hypothetical protein TRIP_B330066 [uncultured Desulfatiglans sp.]
MQLPSFYTERVFLTNLGIHLQGCLRCDLQAALRASFGGCAYSAAEASGEFSRPG